jgi:hypothetical protein
MRLATIDPVTAALEPARRARALRAFETQEWRADFARGVRLACSIEGTRVPRYLRDALRRMRATLGPSELFEVSAPGDSGNAKLAKNASVTLAFTGASAGDSNRYNPCPNVGVCGSFCVLGSTCGLAAAGLAEHMIGARSRRLIAMREHPVAAGVELARACARARRLADSLGVPRVVARMNVGTDIGFESIDAVDAVLERFGIDAYAYTKRPGAVRAAMKRGGRIGRTRIVASWHERIGEDMVSDYLRAGGTVAVVVAGCGRTGAQRARAIDAIESMQIGGHRFPCVNGDTTDDRTTDPAGVVVLLAGKGPLSDADAERLDQVDPLGFSIRRTDPRLRMRAP